MYFFLLMVALAVLAIQDVSIVATIIFLKHPELIYCALYAAPASLAIFVGLYAQSLWAQFFIWSSVSLMIVSPFVSRYLAFASVLWPLVLVWLACVCVHPMTTAMFTSCFVLQFYYPYHSDEYLLKATPSNKKEDNKDKEEEGDKVYDRDIHKFAKDLLCPLTWFPTKTTKTTKTPLIRQGTALRLLCIVIIMLKVSPWTSSTLDWWDSVLRVNPFGLL